MAIVRMKKMKLALLSSEKEMVLDILSRCDCVELKNTEETPNTHKRLNSRRLSETNSKISRLSQNISFLEEQLSERTKLAKNKTVEFEPPKKPLFKVREDISFDDFLSSTKYEYDLMSQMERLEEIASKISEAKSDITALTNRMGYLRQFDALDIAMTDFEGTRNVSFFLGQIPDSQSEMLKKFDDLKLSERFEMQKSGSMLTVFAIAHTLERAQAFDILSSAGFIKTSITTDILPKEEIEKLKVRIESKKEELLLLNAESMNFYSIIPELKRLFDYYSYKLEKITAQGDFRRTEGEKGVYFEAWVPENKCDFVQEKVLERTERVVFEILDPKDDEMPPTMTNNGKVVSAFESVTNMYSVPSYRENDPNFSVMIFFFLFFGFMLSDAGYGLLLAIATFVLLRFVKLETGLKKLVIILFMGGISTIIWGLLFGGFFSIEVEGTIFEKIMWFAPLDNPIGALGLSLGIGVLQILYGMGMRAAELIKRGKWLDAICDVGSWYVLFIGIGLLALSMVPGFEGMAAFAPYVALGGVAMLVLTQGRAQKNIFMKLFKGVGSLYGIVNYVSDILSYARLFGLGLASGVVGMVFNTIGGVFFNMLSPIPIAGPVLGVLLAAAFMLLGHSLNIGINVLGAYVHDCRLQFIEFFGKFYEGGGHLFIPLGRRTKYYRVIESEPEKVKVKA